MRKSLHTKQTSNDALGQGIIVIDAVHAHPPHCLFDENEAKFRVDLSTPRGKSILITASIAASQNKALFVQGSGVCQLLSGYEDVSYVIMNF